MSGFDHWAQVATVIQDRYGGVYSGAPWLAFWGDIHRIHEGGDLQDAHGNDTECAEFFGWSEPHGHPEVGAGATPADALNDLIAKQPDYPDRPE